MSNNLKKSEIKVQIKKADIFRGWIYERFPFIQEDFDSLTSYELWCKVVEYLNKMIEILNSNSEELMSSFNELQDYVNDNFETLENDFNTFKNDVNTLYDNFTTNLVSEFNTFKNSVNSEINTFETNMNTSFNGLSDEFTTLKNWVENYFNNLDVQDEINNKLDDMADDGVFDDLIENQIIPEITNFMNDFQESKNRYNGQIVQNAFGVIYCDYPTGFDKNNTIIVGGTFVEEYEYDGVWYRGDTYDLSLLYIGNNSQAGFIKGIRLNDSDIGIGVECDDTKTSRFVGSKLHLTLQLKKIEPLIPSNNE